MDEHEGLLDAIESGDEEQAVDLMREHLSHIRSKLNLDSNTASSDLHVVFSDLLKSKS